MALLAVYLVLALGGSFLCSVMEAVLLSTPVSFINVKLKEGKKSARLLKSIKENIDRPLSAILSLNTIAHTIGAVGVGAQAKIVFDSVSFGIISGVLTVLILVFSEIIPKTIGAKYWRKLALPSGKIISLIIIVMFPLVILAELVTKLFSGKEENNTVSREELSAMADIGTQEGIIEEHENKIIQNLFKLKTVKVERIMTPRVVVATADENLSVSEFIAIKTNLHYSRVPLYSGDKDNITGYTIRKLVLDKQTDNNGNTILKTFKREIVVVRADSPVFEVWETLIKKKEHIALVVDEFGGMDGIVTMEDIIETILGLEIVDETDRVADMQEFARERWRERRLKYKLLSDEEIQSLEKKEYDDKDEIKDEKNNGEGKNETDDK